MITHQEARKELKQILLSKIDVLYDYITQQEKKDELYKRLFNVCKEYKCVSIGLSDDSEFLNVMSKLEEELKWKKKLLL